MNETSDIVEEIGEPKSESKISPPQESGATATGAAIAAEQIGARIGRKRWVICALLFFAATINYVDRQVIGILKPTLEAQFGWSVNAGRKTAMLVCALAVVPIVFASMTSSLWIAVILIGIAAAAHQGWSANIFTTVSDMFPKQAVGSVVGIGGMAGAIGGMFIAKLVAYVLDTTGSYVPIFTIAASAYLIALLVIHLLAPKLEPAEI